MGRKIRTGALLILVLAMIYTQQAVIYAQNEAEIQMELMEKTRNKRSQEEKKGIKNQRSQEGKKGIRNKRSLEGKMKTKTRNRSSPRLRDMSWKSPRLMERMDIIYQSRPL